VSASDWNSIAPLLTDGEPPDRIARAEAALAAGDGFVEAMAYGEAAESFRTASELYELQAAAATQTLRDEASSAAQAARQLYERLERLEQELYDRAAESARRVQNSEQKRSSARTEIERAELEARWREAKAELELMDRLKLLAHSNVFDLSWRTEIDDLLGQADRDLETARYTDVMSSYAEATSRLEELLSWPERAEAALRQQSALGNDLDLFRTSLGPMALQLADVQATLAETATRIDRADLELTAGSLSEATATHASARESLARAKAEAVAGLLSRAITHENEGKPGTAVLALDELLALDPNHTEAKELRRQTLSRPLINSIGIELVLIPPGEFMMGSPSTELGRDDDERQRRVEMARGFYMAATEVTQSEWLAVMGDNPSRWIGDDLPVEQVAWEDALEFCRRLSDKEERTYRLPTEEEWEYACRAGTTTPFHFGETISPDQANYDGEYAYGHGTTGAFRNQTTPVREFPPNTWGLYDMHGNVWEWCPDNYEYYTPSPVKPSVGATPIEGRVLRGGSWRNRPTYCRCANRVRDAVGSPLSNVGFRVVLETD
jgi:formylglycine-generating enzyme required for sulfatase activity